MPEQDHKITSGVYQQKEQKQQKSKVDDLYASDHLPKLSQDQSLLKFKPLGQINGKASKDRQTKLLIEEGQQKTRGWQLTKPEFIDRIKQTVDVKVNDLLKHVGFSTKDCPWLEAFYADLGMHSSTSIEALLRQYLGQNIESTDDFLAKLSDRIEKPVKHWISTREIQDVPELLEQKMLENDPSNTNGHFNPLDKANKTTTNFPPELKAQLEEFLGASLSSIKLHTGSEANKILQDKEARALTLGQDIYLNIDKYPLDKPEGVAILAHEIMHARQQMGATSLDTSDNSEGLEEDADRGLMALLRHWMQWGKGFAKTPVNLSSGLKVARCKNDQKQENADPLNIMKAQQISPEEKDLSKSQVQKGLKKDGLTTKVVKDFEKKIKSATKDEEVVEAIKTYGQQIWTQTRARVATKKIKFEGNLYWARIWMHTILKTDLATTLKGKLPEYTDLLEKQTRNMASGQINFTKDKATKKILISGFDPFRSRRITETSRNISGTVALYFDGKTIGSGNKKAELAAVIFPVNYKSFNAGMIEKFYAPYLDQVDAIITFSQGGQKEIDIERFYGNYRSGSEGNNHQTEKGKPIISGQPQFYETNLPVNKMIHKNELVGNKKQNVFFDQSYKTDKQTLDSPHKNVNVKNTNVPDFDIKSIKGKAQKGSGGSFFSNELPYRVAHMIKTKQKDKDIKFGHVHLPYDTNLVDQTIKEVQKLLERLKDAL
jgi:pyrrolidone-carboxylate peptidase